VRRKGQTFQVTLASGLEGPNLNLNERARKEQTLNNN